MSVCGAGSGCRRVARPCACTAVPPTGLSLSLPLGGGLEAEKQTQVCVRTCAVTGLHPSASR